MKTICSILSLFAALAAAIAQPAMVEKPSDGQIAYACAPCGCEHDGKYFAAPGACPACHMPLRPVYTGFGQPSAVAARKSVGILLYDGADIMDVTGPWSVFEHAGFNIVTVARAPELISLGMSMQVKPDFTLEAMPRVDILVIPGGGPAESNQDEEIVQWVKERYEQTETVLSVCSGAFFLGRAGLLDGKEATTFASLIPALAAQFPDAAVLDHVKYADNGRIVTSAGLSSGIDAAFHVIAKHYGQGRAQDVANHMEYDWDPRSGYARTQLADNFLGSIRGLVRLFATRYTHSQGDNEQWEYHFTLTDKIPSSKIVKLIATELEKMPGWTAKKVRQNVLSGYLEHPTLGKGKVELHIRPGEKGHEAILSSERL